MEIDKIYNEDCLETLAKIKDNYIGSEISEKYVSMANEKIRIEQSQLKLF